MFGYRGKKIHDQIALAAEYDSFILTITTNNKNDQTMEVLTEIFKKA